MFTLCSLDLITLFREGSIFGLCSVMSGNKQMTKYLLSHKSDINLLDNEQHSVIHWAAVCGKLELLDVLFKAGAKPSTPDKHGAYPLHYAAEMCSPSLEPETTRTLNMTQKDIF